MLPHYKMIDGTLCGHYILCVVIEWPCVYLLDDR